YETPKSDPEKEELKKQIEELQARMNETENRKNTVDEQMALMEKSFQMAFKYIPMSQGTSISLSNNAGKQLVADMGHSVIQGISQFSSKKTHKAKVYLKVFYHVFLLPEGNMNNLQLVNN
ncbi:MAG: conjugative transposon protein TraM, partial [Dysgonamonadaceae bacterium]|nr:conjugative transposon protein TraM [Dysgonamonadaceae bacterium]